MILPSDEKMQLLKEKFKDDKYKSQRIYLASEKGKEARKRASRKYYVEHFEELKDKLYESTKRYYQTERGKAKKAEQNRRYREKKKREREMMRNENI